MLDKNRSRAPLESALSGEVPVAERYRCRSRAERIIPAGLTTAVDLTTVPGDEEQPDTTRPLIPIATAKIRIFNPLPGRRPAPTPRACSLFSQMILARRVSG